MIIITNPNNNSNNKNEEYDVTNKVELFTKMKCFIKKGLFLSYRTGFSFM